MHYFREMFQRLAFEKISKLSVIYVEMLGLFPGLRSTELIIWISIFRPPIYQCSFFLNFFYLQFHESISLLIFMREGEET